MKRRLITGMMLASSLVAGPLLAEPNKVLPPEEGMYHGTFPDIPDITIRGEVANKLNNFESLVGKDVAVVTVGNNWFSGIKFPVSDVQEVINQEKIPLVYVLPWSVRERGAGSEFFYSLDNFLSGSLDSELRTYAQAVKAVGAPVALSFASEANGNWYPWSGVFNGAGESTGYGDPALADGPEKYRDVYRHLINIFNEQEVENATWVFHVTGANKPDTDWNKVAAYYPGDEYIDWVATSIYSAQNPGEEWEDFELALQYIYPVLADLTDSKPIAILEFGTIEDRFNTFRKADWVANALTVLASGRYPRVKAMTYWHESSWHQNGLYNYRIDSSAEALQAYRTQINNDIFVSEPVFTREPIPEIAEFCNCGWQVDPRGNRACTVSRGDTGAILEQKRFSDCYKEICEQLFSLETRRVCSGKFVVTP